MNTAIVLRSNFREVAAMTIEEILEELYAVSFPDLFCSEYNGKWHGVATMRLKVQGAEFKIRSESKHDLPVHALRELLDRVRVAMKQMNDMKGGAPKGVSDEQ